jgi:hypothetical protein
LTPREIFELFSGFVPALESIASLSRRITEPFHFDT